MNMNMNKITYLYNNLSNKFKIMIHILLNRI